MCAQCAQDIDNRNAGRNAVVDDCFNCSLTNSISANALCASGLIWVATGSLIENNYITANGDHEEHLMWADGITCLRCDEAVVRGNTFVGNTDIDFIMGSGIGASVVANVFSHASGDSAAFSCLMCDNFNGWCKHIYERHCCYIVCNTIHIAYT